MDKTEILKQISQKTGVSADICEKVIKVFEEQSGNGLMDKLKGVMSNSSGLISVISEKTGIAKEDCEKVVTMFKDTAGSGLADKLNFLKK